MVKMLCLAAALAMLWAGAAAADDTAMEAKYRAYQEAIQATQRCEKREFTPAEHNALGEEINFQVDGAIGPGKRLTIIEDAKKHINDVIFRRGCEDPEVAERLALFNSDLAPALERQQSN